MSGYPTLVHKTAPAAAGIAVRAKDTGRVLMIQRAKDDTDPASGTWEFPGGHLENGEQPFDGARREWQEEVGTALPHGERAGSWRSGIYQGFVHEIPHETDVPINLDHSSRRILNPDDPDGDGIETAAWWDPQHLKRMGALRPELRQSRPWTKVAKEDSAPVLVVSRTIFRKDQPAASDVHVDAPVSNTSIAADGKRKKKPQSIDEPDLAVKVLKADKSKQLVYGIVLEPHRIDSQGDWEAPDDIEKACHHYLGLVFKDGVTDLTNLQHRWDANGVYPVENYVAPVDFELNGEPVHKGSWVLVMKVDNPSVWDEVEKGEWGGFSVEGTGRRNYDHPQPVVKEAGAAPVTAPVHVAVHFNEGAFSAPHVETHAHLPAQSAPVVNVTTPEHVIHNHVEAAAPAEHPVEVHNHIDIPAPEIHNHLEQPKPRSVRVETRGGVKRYVAE